MTEKNIFAGKRFDLPEVTPLFPSKTLSKNWDPIKRHPPTQHFLKIWFQAQLPHPPIERGVAYYASNSVWWSSHLIQLNTNLAGLLDPFFHQFSIIWLHPPELSIKHNRLIKTDFKTSTILHLFYILLFFI